MQIYGAVTNKDTEEIEKEFEGMGYGTFKMAVAEAVVDKLKPIQEKYNEILSNEEYIRKIYTKGDENARKIANVTLQDVKQKVGLIV